MSSINQPEQQLRKGIYVKQNNPQQKGFFLDLIGDKIGKQNFAYILVTFSTVVFPLGYLYTNQNNFTLCQNFLIRAIALVGMNSVIARIYHIDIEYKQEGNFKILFVRNICITIQSIMYTVAQFYLSQPIITTICTVGPLFVFIIDYKINRIKITHKQFYGVMLGVAGVLMTVNGQLIIKLLDPSYQVTSNFKNYVSDDPLVKFIVASLLVLTNSIWAYALVITKNLKGVNAIQINIHLGLFFLFTTGLFYPTQVLTPVSIQKIVIAVFLGGIVTAIAQLAFVGAITMTQNTGVLTMFVFVSVIEGYLVSVLKYNEQVNPICIMGAILMLYGLAKIVLKNDKSQNQLKQQVDGKKV